MNRPCRLRCLLRAFHLKNVVIFLIFLLRPKKMVISKFYNSAFLIFGTFLSTYAQPIITSFSPGIVCQGNAVTLTGSNFTAATNVKLGSLNAASLVVNSSTSITAVVANTASSGTVTVTTPAGTSPSGGNLTILPAPRPALTDASPGRDIDFTSCDGPSSYQITVRNNSAVSGTGNIYDIDWGDAPSTPFTQTDWAIGAQTTHTYQGQGYFDIVLTITPANGCKKSITYKFYKGVTSRASWSTDPLTPPAGCAPVFVNFVIGDPWPINSLGTTYEIDFGDGTPHETLQHPLNLTNTPHVVPHIYKTSSCPAPTFTATLYVRNACSPVPVTYTQNQIIIRKAPVADFSTSTACAGTPVCFNNLTAQGFSGTSCNTTTSYLWDFGDPASGQANTSTAANPLCHTYPAGTGTYSVTLIASNTGCGSDTITKQITLSPSPDSSVASSSGPLCSGGTLNLYASTVPGATYSWRGPGGYTSNQQNPTRLNATAAMSGTYTVTVTINGCTSPASSVNVVIHQTPAAPTAISPGNYCQFASAAPLTATASSGNSLLWYTVATGGTGSATAPTPPTDNAPQTITYYVSQISNSTQCESARTPVVVNIRTIPSISSGSFANPTTCASSTGSIILSGLQANILYSVCYSKNGGNSTCVNLTANSSGVITISSLSAGTYSNITVTLNGCVSNAVGPFLLIEPNPPATPTARSTAPICAGDTLKLFTDTIIGATYSWTGPSFSSTLQNPVRPNASAAMNGTYFVTIRLNGCTSAPGSVNVAIRAKPAKPVVCASNIEAHCFNNASSPLCATASTQNTLFWCTSFPQSCFVDAPVPRTDTVGSFCYAVYQQSDTSGCKSDTVMICVKVIPKIVNNAIRGDQTLCEAGAVPSPLVQASGSVAGGTGTYTYKWEQATSDGNWIAVGTNPSYSPGSLTVTVNYKRIVFSGGCSDTSNIVTISRDGFSNNTITAPQSICAGSAPSLLSGSTPSGGNGSFSFEWYDSTAGRPRSLVGGSQNYQPPSLDTSTFYIRKVSSEGCTGYTSWIKITVFEKPVAGTISRDTTVCEGSSVTIRSGAIKGVVKKWQYYPLPINGSWLDLPETADSVIFRDVRNSFAVRLLVASSGAGQVCDLSDSSNIVNITISRPSSGGNTNTDDIVCSNANAGVIVLTNYTGQIIRWDSSKTRGASWGAVANTSSSFAYSNLTSTTWFKAVLKNNTCPEAYSDTTVITVVNAVTPSNAGDDKTLCNVNSVILSGNRPSIGTGRWKQVSGRPASITDTTLYNTSVTGLLPDNTYRLAWIITGNGQCSGSSDTVEIRIWLPTTKANAGNDTSICDFTSLKTIALHASQPRSYETGQWSILSGSGGSLSNSASPNSTFTFSQPGNYKLGWRISNATAGSCPASEDTLNISVYEKPIVGTITPVSSSICMGDSITFSYNLRNGAVLKWQYNFTPSNHDTWVDVNSNLSTITFRNVINTFSVRVLISVPGSMCSIADTSSLASVNVTVAPPVSIKVLPSLVLEQPDYTFNFIETSPANANRRYLWSMGDPTLQTRSSKEIKYTYPDTGIFKVKLLVTDLFTGCKSSDSVTVKILYIPGYLYIPNAMCVGCSNNSLRQFLPLGKGLINYRLRIFSKWGKLLFETTSLNPDGSPNEPWRADFSNTMMLQQDSFMWVIEAKFVNNTEWKGMIYPDNPNKYLKSGFITIIK